MDQVGAQNQWYNFRPFFAIHYLDATHFWAAGSNGVVLFSTDGTTWSAQAYPMADLSMADPSFEGSLSTYWTTWSNNNTVGFIRTPQQHKWGSHSLSVLMMLVSTKLLMLIVQLSPPIILQ